MSDHAVPQFKDTTANPAPLGLLAFGMTTVMLNLHNGFGDTFALDAGILAMGLFFGGITQLMVGAMEWKKGNTFGTTAFASYGAFWIVLVALFLMPVLNIAAKPSHPALAAFLILWGTYTFFMFIATLRLSRALQFVFGSLVILFFLLAYEHIAEAREAPVSAGFKMFIGIEGIVCGCSALYTGIAQVLNEVFARTVMPLGPIARPAAKSSSSDAKVASSTAIA